MKIRTSVLIGACCALLLACSNGEDEEQQWIKSSVRIEKGNAVAYFPNDSVSEERMHEVVDSLNLGIAVAQKCIGGPHKWQVYYDKPVSYYFKPGRFVSVTDERGDIYIPINRVVNYTAPWMHETIHALLRNTKGNWNELPKVKRYFRMPLWFMEGMAEYLTLRLEATDSILSVDLMHSGGYYRVDKTCQGLLSQDEGLIEDIGVPGIPTRLMTDRANYAPQFYTCSCSFTRFLVDKFGLPNMIQAASEFQREEETIELFTGTTVSELRSEWISYLASLK